jgi:hypothetical protein
MSSSTDTPSSAKKALQTHAVDKLNSLKQNTQLN